MVAFIAQIVFTHTAQKKNSKNMKKFDDHDHDYCQAEMPDEDSKILKCNQFYLKEGKLKNARRLFVIYINKENYVMHIRALKQALNHGLILIKVHKVNQFNQKAW